jgi:hypothetical protein
MPNIIGPLSRSEVARADGPSPWDFTNSVLYELCRNNPSHENAEVILAKINIIGRVYAAAIERRTIVEPGETGDDFFLSCVVPKIAKSKLDVWILEAQQANPEAPEGREVCLRVHRRTTELFNSISGLNKRSLASKYLHFHAPNHFYIYDSQARQALQGFLGLGNKRFASSDGDPEYCSFVSKCSELKMFCEREFNISLSPRKLDNLLLARK